MVDTKERVLTYLDTLVGNEAPRERRVAYVETAPAVVDELLEATPVELSHMEEYADYFADLEGGSAIGRSVEPEPFDVNKIGEDASRIRTSDAISAPVPMPITSGDFRAMNLMGRRPLHALPTMVKRVFQGVGGKVVRKEMAAGGKALAAALIAGARKAGVEIWLNSPIEEVVVEEGKVTGIVVEREGQRQRVAATAGVILAVGGFDHNGELRRRYQSEALTEDWSFGNPDNTGDMFEIARQVGAGLALLDQAWWFPAIPSPTPGGPPIFMLSERSLSLRRAGRATWRSLVGPVGSPPMLNRGASSIRHTSALEDGLRTPLARAPRSSVIDLPDAASPSTGSPATANVPMTSPDGSRRLAAPTTSRIAMSIVTATTTSRDRFMDLPRGCRPGRGGGGSAGLPVVCSRRGSPGPGHQSQSGNRTPYRTMYSTPRSSCSAPQIIDGSAALRVSSSGNTTVQIGSPSPSRTIHLLPASVAEFCASHIDPSRPATKPSAESAPVACTFAFSARVPSIRMEETFSAGVRR